MKHMLLVGLFLIIGSAHAQSTDRPLMLVAAPGRGFTAVRR